jgi:HTH-type transcriptional regulator/antitoxin HigA
MIGGVNRVYEILNRTRPLTLRMIRNINVELGIPAEVLIH